MARVEITTRLLVDGVEVAAGGTDAYNTGVPIVLEGIAIPWGRANVVDQPDASFFPFTVHQHLTGDPAQVTLFQFLHSGSIVEIRSTVMDTVAGTSSDVLVWVGEITKADIVQPTGRALEASVTVTDPSAALANMTVGDVPWPQESAYARFQHILDAAGLQLRDRVTEGPWSWTLTGDMDPSIQSIMVAYRDVDAQKPLDLIQQLAQTVGGVAWITADETGPYIWIEDPTQRQGLKQFVIDPTTKHITIGQLDPTLANVNPWPAADIIRDPLTWTEDPTTAIKSVTVNWKLPALDDNGLPTSVDQSLVEVDRSKKSVSTMEVDTDLVIDADARLLASHWLAQSRTADWVVSSLSIESGMMNRPVDGYADADRLAQFVVLLDIRQRIGRRLTVNGIPTYVPPGPIQSFYVEGGTYTFTAGRWQMDLNASSNAIGGGSKLSDFPAGTKFSDFAGLTWLDVWGVAPPNLSDSVIPFSIPFQIGA